MKFRDYLELPGVNSHALIEMIRSPLHCWAQYIDPDRERGEPTAAMKLGNLVHLLVLEPDKFDSEFIVSDASRRTNAGKAEHAALAETGKKVISPKEFESGMQVAKSVKRNRIASGLLVTGEPEKTIVVNRDSDLLPLKGRIDWFNPVVPNIVELKTTQDASRDAFMRTIYKYGYHISASYYQMLAGKELNKLPEYIPHKFIAVETEPPYAVAVYDTTTLLLSEGRAIWVSALRRFDECWKANEWPSYEGGNLESNLVKQYQEGEIEL